MKNLFILVLGFIFSATAFANDRSNSCLERASDNEILAEVSRRMGNGNGGNDPHFVDSAVNLQCIADLDTRYPYNPTFDMLITWADQCRETVDSRCILLSSSPNSACVADLDRRYPYNFSDTELVRLSEACKSKRFSCRI